MFQTGEHREILDIPFAQSMHAGFSMGFAEPGRNSFATDLGTISKGVSRI